MFKKINLEKSIIQILAPSTICYRELGQSFSELKYCSWHIAKFAFPLEEVGKDGYFKAIYLNNKRLKAWSIIPRHAFIEIRQKPKIPAIAAWAWVASFCRSHKGLSYRSSMDCGRSGGCSSWGWSHGSFKSWRKRNFVRHRHSDLFVKRFAFIIWSKK